MLGALGGAFLWPVTGAEEACEVRGDRLRGSDQIKGDATVEEDPTSSSLSQNEPECKSEEELQCTREPDLLGTFFNDEDRNDFACLTQLEHLTSLGIRVPISKSDSRYFAISNIQKLYLSGNKDITSLAFLESMTLLAEVYLDDTNIKDEENLGNLRNLKRLDLSGNDKCPSWTSSLN